MAPEKEGSIGYINCAPDRRNKRISQDLILSAMTEFWARAYGKPEADRRRQIVEATFRKPIPKAK